MAENKAYFVAGLRTPFAKAERGSFAEVRPDDLLVQLFQKSKEKHSGLWRESPEDVVVGCAYPEGEQGYNIARMVALGAGLESPGLTVNRLCASSLEAVAIAASRIESGWGSRFLLGGVESMTRIPRGGANRSPSPAIESINEHAYITMGETAENVAARYPDISREKQEEFSARSHELAERAYQENFYQSHVTEMASGKDEFIRFPVNAEKVASLPPAFREDGVVTAATSSPLTDGATSGWVVTEPVAKASGVNHGLEILDAAWSHVAPEVMGLGPVPSTKALLDRNNLTPGDIEAFEINEAFAIQVLATIQDLRLPLDRVNAKGGALALGHPLGASGLRLLMTLDERLKESKDDALGIATLCVGGGQGMALLVKKKSF